MIRPSHIGWERDGNWEGVWWGNKNAVKEKTEAFESLYKRRLKQKKKPEKCKSDSHSEECVGRYLLCMYI